MRGSVMTWRAGLGDDRQVADDEVGQAVRLDRVHGHHRDAIAVGVHEMRVQPVVDGRVLVERHLAPGQHHLALLAVDDVAVDVDVREVVVLAHGLELVQGRAQRPVVPQAGVGERVRVPHQRVGGQDAGRRVGSATSSRPGRRPAGVAVMSLAMNARSWSSGLGLTNRAWLTTASSARRDGHREPGAERDPQPTRSGGARWPGRTTTAATTVSTRQQVRGRDAHRGVRGVDARRVRVGALAEGQAELVQLEADGADGDAQRHQDAQVPRPAASVRAVTWSVGPAPGRRRR